MPITHGEAFTRAEIRRQDGEPEIYYRLANG